MYVAPVLRAVSIPGAVVAGALPANVNARASVPSQQARVSADRAPACNYTRVAPKPGRSHNLYKPVRSNKDKPFFNFSTLSYRSRVSKLDNGSVFASVINKLVRTRSSLCSVDAP
ncbi:hypothetical protein G7K_3579-t1 [Saitoella complicata NRRL Y-17804]|uniref:Uncharacterized protein n=1 Tax=Saitoella complicata (strain BCRC 22490 / CBS 7301 / JCM 7358 / NBRC 10748 / NRRL Y-17804) TaxID=698492 RepID=A0A0E9NHW4_SAICN|nr:hypothetical protein G7K_3579-t1 [Saitoella complicata NRRL Y-17804]